MKQIILTIIMFSASYFAFAQTLEKAKPNDKLASDLARFESNWLTASLNGDKEWLERILTEKLIISPLIRDKVNNRTKEMTEMIDASLLPSEMKVRISGNIIVLTNSSSADDSRTNSDSRNRSYHFLDTFNKRNGKWEIVATHLSRILAHNNLNDEQTIMRLEHERNEAAVKKDIAALRQIIADDFVGIDSSGKTFDKSQFINDIETNLNNIQSDKSESRKVRLSGDTAIVTGNRLIKGIIQQGSYGSRILFTEVWIKRNGQWQMVNHQVTSIV